jgi:hypothetical protein
MVQHGHGYKIMRRKEMGEGRGRHYKRILKVLVDKSVSRQQHMLQSNVQNIKGRRTLTSTCINAFTPKLIQILNDMVNLLQKRRR